MRRRAQGGTRPGGAWASSLPRAPPLLPARALLDLRASIQNWRDFAAVNRVTGWSSGDASACGWTGVVCGDGGRVTALDLDCGAMNCRVKAVGALPPSLAGLDALARLDLANQSFRGPLPAAWGAVGALPALESLNVGLNHLSGALPEWGGGGLMSLRALSLARNELTGGVPATWATLPSLRDVRLLHNQLDGPLPKALGRLNATLWVRPGNYLMCGEVGGGEGDDDDATSPSSLLRACRADGGRAMAPATLDAARDCRPLTDLGTSCSSRTPPTRAAMALPRPGAAAAALGAVVRLRGDVLPFDAAKSGAFEAALAGLLPGVRRGAVSVTQSLVVGGDRGIGRRGGDEVRAASASASALAPLVPGDGGPAATAAAARDGASALVDASVRVLLASAAPDAAAGLERALLAAAEGGALLAALRAAPALAGVTGAQLLVTLPLQPEATTAAELGLTGGGGGAGGGRRVGGVVAAVVLAAAVAGAATAAAAWGSVRAWRRRRKRVEGRDAEAGDGKGRAVVGSVATVLATADSASSRLSAADLGGLTGVVAVADVISGSGGGAGVAAPASPTDDWAVAESDLAICLRPDATPWLLGEGAYGRVFKGVLRGVQPVAVKALHGATPAAAAAFAGECAMLARLRSPNVVQFLGVCRPAASGAGGLLLVTEYCSGGDLNKALARPNADALFAWNKWGRRVATDIARGLAFLHAQARTRREGRVVGGWRVARARGRPLERRRGSGSKVCGVSRLRGRPPPLASPARLAL